MEIQFWRLNLQVPFVEYQLPQYHVVWSIHLQPIQDDEELNANRYFRSYQLLLYEYSNHYAKREYQMMYLKLMMLYQLVLQL